MTVKMTGLAASGGIAVGKVVVWEASAVDLPDEIDFAGALQEAGAELEALLRARAGEARGAGRHDAAEILEAQSLLASDAMVIDRIIQEAESGDHPTEVLARSAEGLAADLVATGVEYLAERAADVREVVENLGRVLAGVGLEERLLSDEPSVIVAKNLTAAQTAMLDPSMVLGFVTEEGGVTGHVAIIARSLGIPAIVGTEGAVATARSGASIAVDGFTGDVIVDPDTVDAIEFSSRVDHAEERARITSRMQDAAVAYRGRPLVVAANVGAGEDIQAAVDAGAQGIGLLRSEFVFLSKPAAPSEQEQFEIYTRAAAAFDHPVIVRTLDIGADKQVSYLPAPFEEENPFLGVRGVRRYRYHPEVVHTQLRALLRAATAGDIWVMVPMVSTVANMVDFNGYVAEARESLRADGIEHGDVRVGAMIEVPGAVLAGDQLAAHVDFVSIGTNDLVQYTMAADRGLAGLAHLQSAMAPQVLRLIAMVTETFGAHDIPVGVCGEAAADPLTALLLAELGVGELSVAPTSVNAIKATIDAASPDVVSEYLHAALGADSAERVRELGTNIITLPWI